jgi:hypothetical protein
VLLHSFFQVSPQKLDRDQFRALAGPLKDILRIVPVIVLLEGKPSPQSEVFSALEQVFIKDLSVLCSVHLSLDPD